MATQDVSAENEEEDLGILEPTFDPIEKREDTRTTLAVLIVLTVPAIVATACFAFLFQSAKVADLRDFTVGILGPVGGIVGAVVGFYFGSEHARRKTGK